MKKYTGKIEIYVHPKWNIRGGYSGNGSWVIEFNQTPIQEFIVILETFLTELKAEPKRDRFGRFIANPKEQL